MGLPHWLTVVQRHAGDVADQCTQGHFVMRFWEANVVQVLVCVEARHILPARPYICARPLLHPSNACRDMSSN